MADRQARRLRTHFTQHNRRVIGLALITAGAALAFWGFIYAVTYWLLLLVITVVRPSEARIPPHFGVVFLLSAAVLCALGWLARRLSPDERPRDKKAKVEVVLDCLLAVPRMTLAVWGNLRALQFLNEEELELALHFLETVAHERRLPAQRVPLEIPGEKERHKILLALQIAGLVEMQKFNNEPFFALRGETARMLAQPKVRLDVSGSARSR